MHASMKSFNHFLLPAAVFCTGASVLIVEVVAIRVLAPYYGNTIFTVSSVLSVILLALSVGYFAGGELADRYPSLRIFFGIILTSGLILLGSYVLGVKALPTLGSLFSIALGPLVSSLLLFFLPALLLGTLSPYAVKLQNIHFPDRGVGSAAGRIFFWSTLGSIVGSLATGFLLIPSFGLDRILISNGVFLFLLGFLPLFFVGSEVEKKHLYWLAGIGIVSLGFALSAYGQTRGDAVYSGDGVYEKIRIYDGRYAGKPVRFLQQDRNHSGAMFLDTVDPTDLVYEYTKYYVLYKIFKPDIQNALVIGGGSYSVPKALLAALPQATVDVPEIEPSLFELVKEYFGVRENKNLHNFTDDGRRRLRNSNKKYDLIFSDAYHSLLSVPSHLTTREFFALAKERLTRDGVFIGNFIGDLLPQVPSFLLAEIRTFQSVFPNSYFFAVASPRSTGVQNFIFVGYNSSQIIDLNAPSIIQDNNPIVRSLKDKEVDLDTLDLSPHPMLTDNFSPVEYIMAKTLQRTVSGP